MKLQRVSGWLRCKIAFHCEHPTEEIIVKKWDHGRFGKAKRRQRIFECCRCGKKRARAAYDP